MMVDERAGPVCEHHEHRGAAFVRNNTLAPECVACVLDERDALRAEVARITSLLAQYELVMTQEDAEVVRDVQRLEAEVARLKQTEIVRRSVLRKIDSLLQDDLGGWYLSAPGHEPLGEVRDRIAAAVKEV